MLVPLFLELAEPATTPLPLARSVAGRRGLFFAASILWWASSTPGPTFCPAMTTNVRTGLADLRKELESPKPDLERCKKLLVQLKVGGLLFGS